MNERGGGNGKRSLRCCVGHRQLDGSGQLILLAPTLAPISICPGIRKGEPIRRPQQHNGVSESGLHVIKPGRNGARVLTRTGPRSLSISAMRKSRGPGPYLDQARFAQRSRTICAIKERLVGLAAGGMNSAAARSGEPLKRECHVFTALDAGNAVIPVRQPLRRNGRECGEDQTHQRCRDQSFKQREARIVSCCRRWPSFAVPLPQADRADFRRPPVGDGTVTTTACGTHRTLGESASIGPNGSTSIRQGWPATSPDKVSL